MHRGKKIIAWIYHWKRQAALAMKQWPDQMEDYLGYCRAGCENCFAWKCTGRKTGQTPYRKFRRGEFKD